MTASSKNNPPSPAEQPDLSRRRPVSVLPVARRTRQLAGLALLALPLLTGTVRAERAAAEPDQHPAAGTSADAPPPAEGTAPGAPPPPRPPVITISVQDIAPPDPGAVSLLETPPGSAAPVNPFDGLTRAEARSLLSALPVPKSAAATRLELRLLQGGGALPALPAGSSFAGGTAEDEPLALLRARKLWALGDSASVLKLGELVPDPAQPTALRALVAEAALLQNQPKKACDRQPRLQMEQHPLSPRLLAYCRFAEQKTAEASFAVSLLREGDPKIVATSPIFFAAADQLSGAPSGALTPDSLLSVSAVDLALLRLAKLPLPAQAGAKLPRPFWTAIARDLTLQPAGPGSTAYGALRQAVAAGLSDGRDANLAIMTLPLPDKAEAGNDTAPTALQEALLWRRLMEPSDSRERAARLADWLKRAGPDAAEWRTILLPLLSVQIPSEALSEQAADIARTLLGAGLISNARPWVSLAQARSAGDGAMLLLLAQIGGLDANPAINPTALLSWRLQLGLMPGSPEGRRRLELAFGLFGVFDKFLPPDAATLLADAPAMPGTGGVSPPDTARLVLERVALNGQRGATLLAGLVCLGESGGRAAPVDTVLAVLRAFRRVGLEQEARLLALDIALANGL